MHHHHQYQHFGSQAVSNLMQPLEHSLKVSSFCFMNFSNRNTFHHHRVLASIKNIPIQVEAIEEAVEETIEEAIEEAVEEAVEVNPSSVVRNSSEIELCYFRRSNSRRCFLYVTVTIECSFDVWLERKEFQ